MRMDTTRGQTAAEWIASVDERTLADVLWRYGEEKRSRRIARVVVEARTREPLKTTAQLARLVASCYPRRPQAKHPATRSFQAIRIHINQELLVLEQALKAVASSLVVDGRFSVISFHSLEDRIVKQFFRDFGRETLPEGVPLTGVGTPPLFRVLGKKTKATDEEMTLNPRARSAVLRVASKTREMGVK